MTCHDLQAEKRIVLEFYRALDEADPDKTAETLARFAAADLRWRGMHPFNEIRSTQSVAERFWVPLKNALGPFQRRPDIFLAGTNLMDGDTTRWVIQMGHLMGLWERPWLDIPPSRKTAFLRYADFHRVEDGTIVETACYVDIIAMLHLAGLQLLPPQTGAAVLSPGPRTHDGLLLEPQVPLEGQQTRDLITAMIDDLVAGGVNSPGDHLRKFWAPDMCWFGPAGIGTSAFFEGYRRGHAQPFEAGLEFVKHHGHACRIGEGMFGGFFGYPSMRLKSTGGFMGMPATSTPADMRIVDLYRREGDKLAENWIFIDLLHFWKQQGLDILSRLRDP